MKKIIYIILASVLVTLAGFHAGYKETEKKIAETAEKKAEEVKQKSYEEPSALLPLKDNLTSLISGYEGDWAIYVEDLKTGEKVEINNKKMVSASLIKLFIMGKIFSETEAGNIKREDVISHLENMITISDNEASNILVSKLGGGEYTDMHSESFKKGLEMVNGFAKSISCPDTEQQRDMKNSRPVPIPEQNYTSVVDCGTFLGKLYRKELVSPIADEEMLSLLKAQTRRWKIPAGLPDEAQCANKTGELSDVENDVAIVFSPGGDYTLCVMSGDIPNPGTAQQNIAEISKTVYEYFNQ